MKQFFLLLLLTFPVIFLYGQEEEPQSNQFDHELELSKLVTIPNSPEAEAFAKYGNTQVNMYSGTPDISIPIYVFKGREIDLPISLTYDASGIKVEQLATQAGLGWNLNVGGRISRIINGNPDDFHNAAGAYLTFMNDDDLQQKMLSYIANNQTFANEQDVITYLDFLKSVNEGYYDTQPDYFSVNVPGLNDHLVLDVATRQPKPLNNPRIKVTFSQDIATKSVTDWTVTREDGTVYHFEQAESTHAQSTDIGPGYYGIVKDYNSSWVLTKIESPNKKDIYEFTYTSLGIWAQPQPASLAQMTRNDVNDLNNSANNYPVDTSSSMDTSYQIDQLFLTEIHHNGKKIVSINLKNREDLDIDSAIDRINFHRLEDEQIFRYFDFEHSYFGNAASPDMLEKRLKLDALKSYSAMGEVYQHYEFEYINPDGVPSRTSLGQDYLGYYNGYDGNSVLYPRMKIGEDTYAGGIRDPRFSFAQTGMLKKITYPTGGVTEFNYESDKTPYNASDLANEEPITVVYGALTLFGGIDPQTVCGDCCMDQYNYQKPKVEQLVFNIPEAGNYNIAYTFSGVQPTYADAYLFFRGVPIGNKLHLPVAYENIIENECNYLVNILWENSMGDQVVYLEPGDYQLTIVNRSEGDVNTVQVFQDNVIPQNGIVGEGQVERAGIRIQSIIDYAGTGEIAQSKSYKYTTVLDGDTASGEIIFNPILQYFTNEAVLIQPDNYDALNHGMNVGVNIKQVANRVASSSGGDRPHVAYAKVFEIVESANSADRNGYSEYNFNTGSSGIFSYGGASAANHYIIDSEVGKQNQMNIYDDQGQVLSRQNFTYGQHSFYLNYGIYVNRLGENALKYPVIKPVAGGYTYEFLNGSVVGTLGEINQVNVVFPQVAYDTTCEVTLIPGTIIPCVWCDDDPCTVLMDYCDYYTDRTCINSQEYSALNFGLTTAGGKVSTTVSMQRIDYFDSENVTTTTTYDYSDASIDHLLRETTTTSSDTDETITVRNHYPKDNNVTGANLLLLKNRLGEVVKSETFINGEHAMTQEKEYSNLNPGVVMPTLISTLRDTSAVEERLEFTFYGNGNIKEAFRPDGSKSSFIWGYDNTLLLARLDGISHAEIGPGNLQFLSDNDIDATSEQSLRDALSTLRNDHPEAQVTTFTYDPLIGLTSVTDPKDYTSFYVYDQFNRLESIKDEDGNVISAFNYNYAQEAVVYDPLNVGIDYGSDDIDHQWFTANISGGSGDYSYAWFEGVGDSSTDFEANASGTDTTYQLMVDCVDTKYVKLVVTDNITGEVVEQTKINNNSCNYPPLNVSIGYGLNSDTFQGFNSNVSGGSGDYSYAWHKGVGTSSFTYEVNVASTLPVFKLFVDCSTSQWVKLVITDNVTGEIVYATKESNNSPCSGGGGGGPEQ